MSETAETLLAGLRSGNRRLLSRTITELENRSSVGQELGDRLESSARTAFSIGITGPPGAGKSTLISILAPLLAARGHRVAVLLVDPTSPVSGGAVLGDRIRFSQVPQSQDIYVRSLGNRGQVGGVTAAMQQVMNAVGAAGFDVIIVETVGAGQSDIAITSIADCTICAVPPGLGDSIQAIKAGIQELADLFVVTKGDRPGANQLRRQLRGVPRRLGDAHTRPVFVTSAAETQGFEDLADDLLVRQMTTNGTGESR